MGRCWLILHLPFFPKPTSILHRLICTCARKAARRVYSKSIRNTKTRLRHLLASLYLFLPMVLASIVARSRVGIYPIIAVLPMFLYGLLFPYEASFEYADKVMLLNLPYVVKEALSWLVDPGIFIGLLLLTTWIGVKISVYLYRKFELEEKSKNRKRKKSGGW